MNIPRINPHDPKWTAYVLGELDEADTQAVERLLESSAEARALVADLEAATLAIDESLALEPSPVLLPAQRAAVRRAADTRESWRFGILPVHWGWSAGSVAVAAGVGLLALNVLQFAPWSRQPDLVQTSVPASMPTRETLMEPQSTRPLPLPAPRGTAPTRAQAAQAPEPAPPGNAAGAARPASATPAAALDAATPDVRQEAAKEKDTGGTLPETITVTGSAPVVDAPAARQIQRFRTENVAPAPMAPGRAIVIDGLFGATGRSRPPTNTESYASVNENTFVRPSQEPLATFSIDVDTAAYSNVRRFLNQGQLPPADAVRIEELLNYFTYDYPRPSGRHPIGATMSVAAAPWNPRNRLVRIGVRARDIDGRRPPSNLVFLIDVSGSMDMPQKLPLVKSSLKLLVDQLGENDRISIVVYAGASGLVLPPTRGDRKDLIVRALDDLQAGGSTNGAAGIQLAYNQAASGFIPGGTNRVILVTDGDFNVGVTSQGDLTRLIEERAKSGVFLSVFGFGMGNLKDSTLEKLADTGNGHYGYIDSLNEARKVFVEQMSGTLVTVAKDVKIQVDFNPAKVEAYRLIGYENRALRPEDFNNDLKDAGDMGAGHTVTALFEVVPRGGTVPGASVDPSIFQSAPRDTPPASSSNDMLVLRVRYKLPDAATSTRMDVPLTDRGAAFSSADTDFRFAASVAAFGMILKGSPYRGEATLPWVLDTATASRGPDRGAYRAEFISLVQRAIALQDRPR